MGSSRRYFIYVAVLTVLLVVGLVALPAAIRGAVSYGLRLRSQRETGTGMVHVGLVDAGRVQLLASQPSLSHMVQLTSIQMQAAQSPESGQVDLSTHEGRIIVFRGLDGGGWVYSAQIVEVLGPFSTALVRYAYCVPLLRGEPR